MKHVNKFGDEKRSVKDLEGIVKYMRTLYLSRWEFIWKYGPIVCSGNLNSQQLRYNRVTEVFVHKWIWEFSKRRNYFWLLSWREQRKFKDLHVQQNTFLFLSGHTVSLHFSNYHWASCQQNVGVSSKPLRFGGLFVIIVSPIYLGDSVEGFSFAFKQ